MAEIKPAQKKNWWETMFSKVFPTQYDKSKEDSAMGILAIEGDPYAQQEVVDRGLIKQAAVPNPRGGAARIIAQALEKNLGKEGARRAALKAKVPELFQGEGVSNAGTRWWTESSPRAASYGEVRSIKGVPKWMKEAGKKSEEYIQGMPNKAAGDTVLPDKWTRAARARPDIQPEINIAEDYSQSAADDLFASLGIKRF